MFVVNLGDMVDRFASALPLAVHCHMSTTSNNEQHVAAP